MTKNTVKPEIKIGDRIERLDPTSSSHRHPGTVVNIDETHAHIQWDPMRQGGKGRTNSVQLSAYGKRWQKAPCDDAKPKDGAP